MSDRPSEPDEEVEYLYTLKKVSRKGVPSLESLGYRVLNGVVSNFVGTWKWDPHRLMAGSRPSLKSALNDLHKLAMTCKTFDKMVDNVIKTLLERPEIRMWYYNQCVKAGRKLTE